MAGESGFSDLEFDLVSVQYHALKAVEAYEEYIQDALDAGREDVAAFFREMQEEDMERAQQCHELLKDVQGGE